MALQRDCRDQTISQVGMKIRKAHGSNSDRAIDVWFDQPLLRLLPTPQPNVFGESNSSPLLAKQRIQ